MSPETALALEIFGYNEYRAPIKPLYRNNIVPFRPVPKLEDIAKKAPKKEEKAYFASDVTEQMLSEIRHIPLLSWKEVDSLVRQAQNGTDEVRYAAKAKLAYHFLPFVVKIAKNYHNVRQRTSLADKIQDGSIGLWTSIDRFNYHLGRNLTGFVKWGIVNEMVKGYRDNCATVRIPSYKLTELNKVKRASGEQMEKTGEKPSDEKLAELLGWSKERLKSVMDMNFEYIDYETLLTLNDKMIDALVDDFYKTLQNRMIDEKTARLMIEKAKLKEEDIYLLRARCGFDGEGGKTLQQIGNVLGLTRQAVQLREKEIFSRMKRALKIERLVMMSKGQYN